jgi:hypothetical protein
MATTSIEKIKNMEVECAKLYAETTGVWMQLTEDVELQEIIQKIHTAQDKAEKFKAIIITLPPTEVVTVMDENKKLYFKINHLKGGASGSHKKY